MLRLTIDLADDHDHEADALAALAGEPFDLGTIAETFARNEDQPVLAAERAINDYLLDRLDVDVEVQIDIGSTLRRFVSEHP